MMAPSWALGAWSGCRRGSRVSVRGGRQGIDDLIWDGDERFLTYANTDLQLFKMMIAILCLNGVEQPFKGHQCPFCLPESAPSARVPPSQGWAPDPAPPPWLRAWVGPPWIRAWVAPPPWIHQCSYDD